MKSCRFKILSIGTFPSINECTVRLYSKVARTIQKLYIIATYASYEYIRHIPITRSLLILCFSQQKKSSKVWRLYDMYSTPKMYQKEIYQLNVINIHFVRNITSYKIFFLLFCKKLAKFLFLRCKSLTNYSKTNQLFRMLISYFDIYN